MTTLLVIWLGVGSAIAAAARRWLKSSWGRALGGGFMWPTYIPLIAVSRFRYGRRRRSLS